MFQFDSVLRGMATRVMGKNEPSSVRTTGLPLELPIYASDQRDDAAREKLQI